MILAFVEIPLPEPRRSRAEMIDQSLESTRIFHRVPGLLRKVYLDGETGAGGLYEFASREAALDWFNDGWADWMEGRFGVRPTLRLFEGPVVLDNTRGQVRVDGCVVPPPWRSEPA